MLKNDTLPLRCVFIFVEVVKSLCSHDPETQKTDITLPSVTLTFLSVLLLCSRNLFVPDQLFFKGSEGSIICFQGLKERDAGERRRDNYSSPVWKIFPADREN